MTDRVALYLSLKPRALKRLLDNPAFEPLRGHRVKIYSTEHRAYWGPDWSGYFDSRFAGVYSFEEAYRRTSYCGPEKGIHYELVEERKYVDPGPYRAVSCPCGHGSCRSWLVEPVAAVQGVSLTREQAELVAALLTIHSSDGLTMAQLQRALVDPRGDIR